MSKISIKCKYCGKEKIKWKYEVECAKNNYCCVQCRIKDYKREY